MNTRHGWLAALVLAACGEAQLSVVAGRDDPSASMGPVTWVDQSKVERQSIGNCWLYATSGWAESLHEAATGTDLNTSQSYETYWHWFDQITSGRAGTSLSTGGTFATAVDLYRRYGLMVEGDFIPEEATREMSSRQASALARINAALATGGTLSTTAARRDRALVRAELDKAWALSADTVALLNQVFGVGVTQTIDRAFVAQPPPSLIREDDGREIRVIRPVDLSARVRDTATGTFTTATLADAIGVGWARTGKYAWGEESYPRNASGRRALQKRIQRALNDHQPVVISWFVDFNAMGRDGTFTLEELARLGTPGHQGGHMVVMHDYEVENVPGFGTLKAGVEETRPEALEAALSDQASIRFFRVKNSWGTVRPDRWDETQLPGYHDLYQTYLDGPVKQCSTLADGSPNLDSCWDRMPWWDVVLPAGY